MVSAGGSNFVDGKSLVLGAVDIVQLVGETVSLKRAGRRMVGLCPFHDEKSPSFGVNGEQQFFYCFGCKKGGNAIDFVIERDRCDFRTALQTLADWAGVELPRSGRSRETVDRLGRLREACSAAANYYHKLLLSDEGTAARDYLKGRGFDKELVKELGIGFAPDAFNGLSRGGLVKTFGEDVLAEAGLLRRSDKGGDHRYDVLRHRVIFPIRDEQGRPIAFGGRVVPGNDSPAKYLNSPETPLFDKSGVLYGLDLAKAEMARRREAIVFEGYADVAAARQFGIKNGVAVLGTALTAKHAQVLRRFVDKVVLLFDADAAGASAVRRSVELFLSEPIDVVIAELPAGLDPDDYLREQGVEAFRERVGESVDALTYLWRRMTRQLGDAASITEQQKVTDDYLDFIAAARSNAGGTIDAGRWGALLRRIERMTGVSMNELNDRFQPRRTRRDERRPAAALEPDPRPATRHERAGAQLLGSLFRQPSLWEQVQEHVSPEDLADRRQQWIATHFWEHLRHEGEPTFAEWLDVVGTAAGPEAGGTEQAAAKARAACIRYHDDATPLGDPKAVAADAVRSLLRMRDEASLEAFHVDVRRGVGQAREGADEATLLRRFQERVAAGHGKKPQTPPGP